MLTFRFSRVTSLRQQLCRTCWLCALSFAVGALVPLCLGLLCGPRMDLAAPLAAITAGLFASFALTRWESNFAWRTVVVLFACTLMPAASCAGTVALGLSPLDPLRFGLRGLMRRPGESHASTSVRSPSVQRWSRTLPWEDC